MGGAGHEVRDLPQSPDVGGIVPLLHLLLDEAFQLLPERLKGSTEPLVPSVNLGQETQGPSCKCPPRSRAPGQSYTWDPWAPEDAGQFHWDFRSLPKLLLGQQKGDAGNGSCSLCPVGSTLDSSLSCVKVMANTPPHQTQNLHFSN